MSTSGATTGNSRAKHAWVGSWLRETHRSNPQPSYYHSRLEEEDAAWSAVSGQLAAHFREAHSDAIHRIQRLAGVSLHPAGAPCVLPPPYEQYPFGLPDITVQGYFGEIMAGLLAEALGAAGIDDWEVPAHLFHAHIALFQQLEHQAQSGVAVQTIFGRVGDDCLAFRRNAAGEIISLLYCEAKCTREHDVSLIDAAHTKVNERSIVDIHQLVEALEYRNTPTASEWAAALRVLHRQLHSTPRVAIDERDAVFYVHGQAPVRNETWIPPDKPHDHYTAPRTLHSVEVCLADVLARVRSIYQAGAWQ